MADDESGQSGQTIRSGWTDGRVAMLRDMWLRGMPASQVAESLGGVSRNAVIGKAHRLGLEPRSSDGPGFEQIRFLEAVADPLLRVAGSSMRLDQLRSWHWSDGTPYLDEYVSEILFDAGIYASTDTGSGAPLINCDDLVFALQRLPSHPIMRERTDSVLEHLAPLAFDMAGGSNREPNNRGLAGVIVRWDVVSLLLTAAAYRTRLVLGPAPIRLEHLVAAWISTLVGQAALERAGLADGNLEPFRGIAGRIMADHAKPLRADGPREIALMMSREIIEQKRFAAPATARAGYASDAAVDSVDSLGIARDVRALADLVLLEAATPPLAIGVFGAWGSGKSTLLAQLRMEIAQQAEQERSEILAGTSEEDPAIRRVSGVIQLEFNAWSFADSSNLWASLASDIFEQIAAGGSGARDRHAGAMLVADLAERRSKEAGLLRSARASLEESQEKLLASERATAAAAQDRSMGLVDAVAATVTDLLCKADEKADKADKADDKKRSKEEREGSDDGFAIFRDAALTGDDIDAKTRISKYAEARGKMARFARMAWDLVRARGLIRTGVAALVMLAIGYALYASALRI
jgi:hypothetical protein